TANLSPGCHDASDLGFLVGKCVLRARTYLIDSLPFRGMRYLGAHEAESVPYRFIGAYLCRVGWLERVRLAGISDHDDVLDLGLELLYRSYQLRTGQSLSGQSCA